MLALRNTALENREMAASTPHSTNHPSATMMVQPIRLRDIARLLKAQASSVVSIPFSASTAA